MQLNPQPRNSRASPQRILLTSRSPIQKSDQPSRQSDHALEEVVDALGVFFAVGGAAGFHEPEEILEGADAFAEAAADLVEEVGGFGFVDWVVELGVPVGLWWIHFGVQVLENG